MQGPLNAIGSEWTHCGLTVANAHLGRPFDFQWSSVFAAGDNFNFNLLKDILARQSSFRVIHSWS